MEKGTEKLIGWTEAGKST